MIEGYGFGWIRIGGKEYLKDVIIFPDRLQPNWLRKEGHLLQPEDLIEVFGAKPKVLIVGTGQSGVMKVSEAVRKMCRDRKIALIELRSGEAARKYNELAGPGVIGAFHLTC